MHQKDVQRLKSLATAFKTAGLEKQTVLTTLTQLVQTEALPFSEDDVANLVDEIFDPDKKKTYLYNDLGNKERFIDMYEDVVRYDSDAGCWIVWDDCRWKKDSHGVAVQALAEKSVHAMIAPFSVIPEELERHYKSTATRSRINAFLALAQRDERMCVNTAMLDADPMLLCCKNGTIDLRTGKLREFSPNDMITKMCNVEYDPDCEIPRFTQFLKDITCNDKSLQDYLQKLIGYSLTGLTIEQELYFFMGSGANGKSTLVDVLNALMGEYGKMTRAQTFEQTRNRGVENDIAALSGARLVMASELDQGMVFSDSVIKKLTGDEKVTARFLYKEFFEHTITYKIFILANHKPVIKDTTYAMWRRIRVIPFDYTVPKKKLDPTLKNKIIAEELPGILAWAVEGCIKYQREGLIPPKKVVKASEMFRKESNQLARFVEECCVLDKKAKIYNKDLRNVYADWCRHMAHQPISQGAFSECLQALGLDSKRAGKKGETVWKGICLKGDGGDDIVETTEKANDHATDYA